MNGSEIAVSIIREYIDQNLFSPSYSWPKDEFKKRSYSQWAAYEIINRIMDKPFDMPICVIENFIYEMTAYTYCGDKYNNFIFHTAIETAEELILLFV